jgi:hypothetical protein
MPAALWVNFANAGLGLAVALIETVAAYWLGRLVLMQLSRDEPSFRPFVPALIGAALYSFAFSVLSLLNGIRLPILGVAVLAPFFFRSRLLLAEVRSAVRAIDLRGVDAIAVLMYLAIGFYVVYVALYALPPFRGADLGIYHLVVPREVIRDGGFNFNPFFFSVGYPLGWHMFGLPGYAFGGAAGYLALSLIFFVLMLDFVGRVVRMEVPDARHLGLFAALMAAFVTVGMTQGAVTNNDVPVTFATLVCLYLACRAKPDARSAAIVGLIAGFAIAIKLTAVAGTALACVILLVRGRRSWASVMAAGAITLIPLAAIWPLDTFVNTGSPVPNLFSGMRGWGEALPHFAATTSQTMSQLYGRWYEVNYDRFFVNDMIGFSFILLLIPIGLVFARSHAARVGRVILALAVATFAIICLLNPRVEVLFHDRYLELSYVMAGVAGLCFGHGLLQRLFAGRPRLVAGVEATVLLAIVAINASWGGKLRDPNEDGSVTEFARPALLTQMSAGFETMLQDEASQYDDAFRYIREQTPRDALIATTSVAPYALDRRFIQMLPPAQNVIDLRLSPEQLLAEMSKRHVCYLHVPFSSGLNPWMNARVEPWLQSLRKVCFLPNVKLLVQEKVVGLETLLCRLPGCGD